MDIQFDTISELVTFYGLKVLAALAIFFIGKWVAKRLVKLVENMMRRAKVDPTLIGFAGNLLYALALTFIVIASLSKLGIETTSLAAIIAAAGLAIGLALQGSLSNFAAGVMIILFRPFVKGDWIEAAGVSGGVEEISIFTTILKTADNKNVIVPNSQITSGNIINYSANDTRRIDLVIGVGYDDDLPSVKKALTDIVARENRILDDPAPVVAVSELGESSVNFVVRPWVKTSDYWAVRFDLMEAIKIRLDEEGISIPYPQRDLHIIDKNLKQKIAA